MRQEPRHPGRSADVLAPSRDRRAVGVNHWQGTPPHLPKDVIREKECSIAGSQRAWGYIQMATESVEQRVDVLRQTIIALVRRDGPDLSARQLGVFLTSYLEDEAQTVRGLAAKLNVSKPAITRALDRLSEFDLVRRKTDPLDRGRVLVQRTASGATFLRDLKKIFVDAGEDGA